MPVVSREVDPNEMAVVTVGAMHAGTVPNVIPGTAELRAGGIVLDRDLPLMAALGRRVAEVFGWPAAFTEPFRVMCRRPGEGATYPSSDFDLDNGGMRVGTLLIYLRRPGAGGGTAFPKLCDWMQHLLGDEYAWSLTLVVRHREVPAARLGTRLGNGTRLGWTTWIATTERVRDADEVRIPMARRGGRHHPHQRH